MKQLLEDILTIPTIALKEHAIHSALAQFATRHNLKFQQDSAGNSYITYSGDESPSVGRRPLFITAHTDHPGFIVTEVNNNHAICEFRGGLSAEYGKSEYLCVYRIASQDVSIAAIGKAQIQEIMTEGTSPRQRIQGATVLSEPGVQLEVGDLLLWDVTAFEISNGSDPKILARQCDDLIGVVSILQTLKKLSETSSPYSFTGLFTRAEEIGLMGASAATKSSLLPADAIVIAIETSSGAGGRAIQGGGPIIRVGDAGSIFTPKVTTWMEHIASNLSQKTNFRYQRLLMDAGSTEATAFFRLGLDTGALCVSLGAWHNAGPNQKIVPETVSFRDTEYLVDLLNALVENVDQYDEATELKRKGQVQHTEKSVAILADHPIQLE
jgi:putative aminopeptidase FrvX